MLKCLAGCLVGLALVQVAGAEDSLWLTDLGKAQDQARQEHKLVLLDFNGSDWCPACQILKKQVFATPEFREYAKKNLVLVDVDFPNDKKLPKKQLKANEGLEKKFDIDGFPTVVVLSSAGQELDKKSGYEGQSAKDYIAELDKLKSKPIAANSPLERGTSRPAAP